MMNSDYLAKLRLAARQGEVEGRFDDAESCYQQIVKEIPGAHSEWQALGLLAVRSGRLLEAAGLLEKAISIDGQQGIYWRNLGEIRRRLGQLDSAISAGQRAARLIPTDVDVHYNLGLAYSDAGRYDQAIPYYQQALELNPEHGFSWNNLGSALEKRDQPGDKNEAKAAYTRAVQINPQHAEALNNLGAIQSEQGLLDEARLSFEAAIAHRPDFTEAHFNYSSLHTYTADDPHLVMLEGVASVAHLLSDHARVRYYFALGKALDDAGMFDRAFAAYEKGNSLQHAILPTDEQRADELMARIIDVFDEKFFQERKDWQIPVDGERTPIFIVGMPRSGTTLLEQILCSHPSVYGAGELVEMNRTIMSATSTPAASTAAFCDGVTFLDELEMLKLGRAYLDRVWQLSPEMQYITDKMPANFFYLGVIHLALPGAKIIHSMRDPMDSCFSCYARLFNQTMSFAYDQVTLGRYYVRYRKLMEHWHTVLPKGSILDLSYEDMVADLPNQARRIIEFVGLPWDESCLNFHQNTRLVKTASIAQVRKPIYGSSIARWKNFAVHLRPLYNLVKDWRDGQDANEVERLMESQTAAELHSAGIGLYRQNRFPEALELYERAVTLKPNAPVILNSQGFVLQDMGRLDEARACFERAVELAPTFAMARLNLGLAQLKSGDWEPGWNNYEARWDGSAETGQQRFERLPCPLPQWDGQNDVESQSILVLTEQGFGDVFQFSRLLAELSNRFARVGFVCSLPTLRLMEWSFGDQVALFYELPADFAGWDWHCPLMSLPRALRLIPTSVPADIPYLHVTAPAKAYWAQRLNSYASGLRIGIAWSGRANYQYNDRRSLAFQFLQPLLANPQVTWVSLQKWKPEDQPAAVAEGVRWIDWTNELSDFATTAALVSNLDLIISVDSVIVHLAGALDVPVWMLDRFDNEWRWMHQRNDSPWYPKLRIFRQPAFGEWAPAVAEVREALASFPVPPRAAQEPIPPVHSQVSRPEGLSVSEIVQLAGQLQNAGRGEEAEGLLRQLVAQYPDHAHAQHLLGVILFQGGKQTDALNSINRAIEIDSQVALFRSNLAEMYRQTGQLEAAVEHGRKAVELDPSMASAHSNLGVAWFDLKAYENSRESHEKALAIDPHLIHSLNNLGSIERALKNPDAAIEFYRKVLAIQPTYVESMSNLGAVLVEEDRVEEAVECLEKALELSPQSCEVLCNLGLCRLRQERNEDCLQLLVKALQARPNYPEALIGLGRCLSELDRRKEALEVLKQATVVAPENANAWCHYGCLAMEEGESSYANAAFLKALSLDPSNADSLTGLGNLRLEEGMTDEAVRLAEQAIALKPDHLAARFHLIQARKVKPGDSNLEALEVIRAGQEGLSDNKRISLNYALGKAYDDLGQYDRAFSRFLEGAAIKRGTLEYDVDVEAKRTQKIIEITNAAFLKGLAGAGNRSELPIFVLGMPRSGTTLTEQIIASHPDVFGAGELHDLMCLVQSDVAGHPWQQFPENLNAFTPEHIKHLGDEYVQRLQKRAPGKKRITDKMPANYLALGLIPLLLPGSRIIHVRRNPVDTCVSCFTRLFNRHQEATYELSELGRHYVNYMKLMEHWREVLPAGSFLEVQYEDVVADMEGQARRLIEFCGLPWNDACLSFHKTKRSVRTASVTQVRQPIYSSSVERWRNYETHLAPLIEALGDYWQK